LIGRRRIGHVSSSSTNRVVVGIRPDTLITKENII
jgi:hypothetical protein